MDVSTVSLSTRVINASSSWQATLNEVSSQIEDVPQANTISKLQRNIELVQKTVHRDFSFIAFSNRNSVLPFTRSRLSSFYSGKVKGCFAHARVVFRLKNLSVPVSPDGIGLGVTIRSVIQSRIILCFVIIIQPSIRKRCDRILPCPLSVTQWKARMSPLSSWSREGLPKRMRLIIS